MENKDNGGLRYNSGKLRYDLLPQFAMEQLVQVFTSSANKYEPRNWEKGLSWMDCVASLKRHIAAFEKGADYDGEDGQLAMAHAAWNCLAICEMYKTYPQGDDRQHSYLKMPKIGLDIDDVIADFCTAYREKFKVPVPKFWHFSYHIAENLKDMEDFYLSLKPKISPDTLKFEPVCYITSRPVSVEITKQWIEDNGFPCVPVYNVPMGTSKLEVAKNAGIDVFIDDRFDTFTEFNKAGIDTFLLSAPHNLRYDVGYKRIENVNEVIECKRFEK